MHVDVSIQRALPCEKVEGCAVVGHMEHLPATGPQLHDNLIQCLVGLSVASVPSLHRYQNLEEEKN